MAQELLNLADGEEFHYEKRRGGQVELAARSRSVIAMVDGGEGALITRAAHHRFSLGDMLVMPEGGSYLIDLGEDGRVSLLSFRPQFLSDALRLAMRGSPTVIPADQTGEAAMIAMRLGAEARHGEEFAADLFRAYAAELCVIAARATVDAAAQPRLSPTVEAVLSHITEHYGERLSLTDMAEMTKVSTAYLSRKFKAEVGVGLSDYVATFRLERAEKMLRDKPEMSITEIAFACGFNDSNYFSDKFKKHFGASPLKFKKSRK